MRTPGSASGAGKRTGSMPAPRPVPTQPPVGPSPTALAGGVEAHDRQVQALEGGPLGRYVESEAVLSRGWSSGQLAGPLALLGSVGDGKPAGTCELTPSPSGQRESALGQVETSAADYPGASALIDPMGVTVFGVGARAAVLSAEVDPRAVRAPRRNAPVSDGSRKYNSSRRHLDLGRLKSTVIDADAAGNPWGSRRHVVAVPHRCTRCP